MANDNRSLWKRITETIQTIKPIEPSGYKARTLSMEAQRENALNWLSKQPYSERKKEAFGSDIPSHLLKDHRFAKKLHERFGEKVADKVLPLETRRTTEYQASTTDNYGLLNAALQHDEKALQLPTKDHSEHFSDTDKLHAIETVRRMGPDEALSFLKNDVQHQSHKQALHALSDDILTNKDFLLAIDAAGVELHNLPQHIRDNDKLMTECIKKSPFFFEVASKEIRGNQAIFEYAIEAQGDVAYNHEKYDKVYEQAAINYSRASTELRASAENFTLANSYSMGKVYPRDVPTSLRNDKQVIEEQLLNDPNALRYASRELRKDKQFILDMTERYQIDIPRGELIKDRQIAVNLTRTDSVLLHGLPDQLKNDREFVMNVVRLNGAQLQFATPEMKNDREVVLAAINSKNIEARIDSRTDEVVEVNPIWYASKELRDDYDVALTALQRHGDMGHCSERLRADPYLAEVAIKVNPLALEYASKDIQDDPEFVKLAVEKEPQAIAFASDRLKNDISLAEFLIEHDPGLTTMLGDDIKERLISHLTNEQKHSLHYLLSESEPSAGYILAKGLEGAKISIEREALALALPKHTVKESERAELHQSLEDLSSTPEIGNKAKPISTVVQSTSTTQEVTAAAPKRKFKL